MPPFGSTNLLQLGDVHADVLSDGTFALDGGAMFGVVPRVLWQQTDPPDAKNRITLGLNVLLVETQGRRVLVDTGLGDKWSEIDIRKYRIDRSRSLLGDLEERGISPADIDVVVNTHLHFDHAGGNTRLEGGRPVPTFPRARYVVQRGEWEDALNAHERNRASYLDANYRLLKETGQLDLVEGEVEVAPGVRVVPMGGHTTHHQMVVVEGGGRTVVVPTDVLPTTSHLPLPFIMGYDLFPVDTLEAKRRLLRQAVDGGWWIVFYHDPRTPLGRVGEAGGRYFLREATA